VAKAVLEGSASLAVLSHARLGFGRTRSKPNSAFDQVLATFRVMAERENSLRRLYITKI